MNPFTIFDSLYKWMAIVGFVLVLALGAGYKGYSMGEEHQKTIYAAAQAKANAVVVKKNEDNQAAADKESQTQVVYKDKIITKYQTVTKEVVKYVETPAANTGLDPEFVRLHNDAASRYDAIPITQSASGVDGQATITGVTTGEAIGVITRNYERYQKCAVTVEGWQRFYQDLQKTVNK